MVRLQRSFFILTRQKLNKRLMYFAHNLLRPSKEIIKELRGQSPSVMPDLIRHPDHQTLLKDAGFPDESETSTGCSLSRISERGWNEKPQNL
jgi:hypothetical protein